MKLDFVDAFISNQPFSGNPAAVIQSEYALPVDIMQRMAAQHNLSETAFVWPIAELPQQYYIRWFTPTTEVDLCGHATLAAAHVLFNQQDAQQNGQKITFHTQKHGQLLVLRRPEGLCMNFPIQPQRRIDAPPLVLTNAVPKGFSEVYFGIDWVVVYEDPDAVLNAQPDFSSLTRVPGRGVVLTATGIGEFDFMSRFFAPRYGINEDPVTGSAHCALGPYWSVRLERKTVTGWQASRRGGIVSVEVGQGRVNLLGHCRTYSSSEIHADTLTTLALAD